MVGFNGGGVGRKMEIEMEWELNFMKELDPTCLGYAPPSPSLSFSLLYCFPFSTNASFLFFSFPLHF